MDARAPIPTQTHLNLRHFPMNLLYHKNNRHVNETVLKAFGRMLIGNWLAGNRFPCQLLSNRGELKLTVFQHLPGRQRGQGHWDLWGRGGTWFLLPITAALLSGAVLLLLRADHSAKTNGNYRGMDVTPLLVLQE